MKGKAMRVNALLIAAAVAAAMPLQLRAEVGELTTAVLYDECTNHPVSSLERAHCNGFVHGFFLGAPMGTEAGGLGPVYCGGEPAESQLVGLFQTYVRAHPEVLPKEARFALIVTFVSAFPCEKGK